MGFIRVDNLFIILSLRYGSAPFKCLVRISLTRMVSLLPQPNPVETCFVSHVTVSLRFTPMTRVKSALGRQRAVAPSHGGGKRRNEGEHYRFREENAPDFADAVQSR
jgi:hypothetical protein